MKFINQHSFVLFGAMLLLILGISVARSGVTVWRAIIFAGLILGLMVTHVFLKPEVKKSLDPAQLSNKIGAGNPVLLEFLSPY